MADEEITKEEVVEIRTLLVENKYYKFFMRFLMWSGWVLLVLFLAWNEMHV